eukprot:CAMPEP_0181034650 /NCGR_PEP_ID=MMETSP1070-20121207/7921_1 /TAXON_ID=265543 /ORGANISM="Minutocellus polymorphus, Strain NH13" /LENGTH=243 /DNA_ID=CAMNT_0023112193 /DNA_START=22 /DNA_END=753 /DNA_ORIENTATION=+
MPPHHRRRRRLTATASLVALAALQAASCVDAQRVDHPWRCCGIRQPPLDIKPTDEIAFAIDGEADVWEFDDEDAYKACDFSRAKQIVADASGKAVAPATGSDKTRYFSSKKGMLGNACAVDEWPLKLQVNAKGEATNTGAGGPVSAPGPTTRKRIKYLVKRKKSCDGVGKANRRGRQARKCKQMCNKMNAPGKRYCYAYQYDRKKPAAKRCMIYTKELRTGKVKAGPTTSICYIKKAAQKQVS